MVFHLGRIIVDYVFGWLRQTKEGAIHAINVEQVLANKQHHSCPGSE